MNAYGRFDQPLLPPNARSLYQAELGIGDRCQIEWFVGPHTIHGQGTFAFLHRHLDWPQP